MTDSVGEQGGMHGGGDDISPAELRSIPLAVLRQYARAAAERASVRSVAERIGIGRTTLNYFISGDTNRNPHPRVRRKVALWYVSDTGGVEVDADACESLLRVIPPEHRRGKAVDDLMAFVRDLCRRHVSTAG